MHSMFEKIRGKIIKYIAKNYSSSIVLSDNLRKKIEVYVKKKLK